MLALRGRRLGLALVTLSAVLWSTAGLFVRMASLDTWTMVAWRSVFAFLTLGALVLMRERGRLLRSLAALGGPDAVSILLAIVSTISYVTALQLTTVANVMTIFAVLPFIAGGIAFLWLGERVTVRFLAAGTAALAGVAVMAGAVTSSRDVLGVLAALVMTTGFATQLVHTKKHPALNLALAVAVAALLCVPFALPFMRFDVLAPKQLLACALYGVLTTGLAYILALQGGRLISSGEAGLISMLEVVLGPLWVWLLFDERPAGIAVASGIVVLASVLWYLLTGRPAVQPEIAATGT